MPRIVVTSAPQALARVVLKLVALAAPSIPAQVAAMGMSNVLVYMIRIHVRGVVRVTKSSVMVSAVPLERISAEPAYSVKGNSSAIFLIHLHLHRQLTTVSLEASPAVISVAHLACSAVVFSTDNQIAGRRASINVGNDYEKLKGVVVRRNGAFSTGC